ncbi:MAG TPA: hypothetical protein VMY42_14410 [Thermoguttaceae bacterium]|nr:hypothetical protein [Thermoguttaceae bacterium]
MTSPSRWKLTTGTLAVSAVALWLLLALSAAAEEPAKVEEPAPPERPTPTREILAENYRVKLDLSTQVLRLGIPDDKNLNWGAELKVGDEVGVQGSDVTIRQGEKVVARLTWDDRLRVGAIRGKWIGVVLYKDGQTKSGWVDKDDLYLAAREATIEPTLDRLAPGRFVSASVLAQKAKQFDDGLYAAVDLAAQRGAGDFPAKADLLKAVARALVESDPAELGSVPGVLLGAAGLGKLDPEIPADFQPGVQETLDRFLEDELRSKPIGFYTWSDELSAIFQQDRLLQTKLDADAGIEAVVKILHADRNLRTAYEQYLTLVSRLTNPLVDPDSNTPRLDPDLRGPLAALDRGRVDVPPQGVAFFPPSRTHETRLVMQLYGDRPIPDGFSLVDEMIRRIRSGDLDLKPTDVSGWYDHQTWALEPLVIPEKMPEAKHLEMDDNYRKQLLELFKGILALTRETHIKQAEIPTPGDAAPDFGPPKTIVRIHPELSAEPLATHYLRRALAYRFIRTVLEENFGAAAMAEMHRQTAAGPIEVDLAAELDAMEGLFFGAYLTVSRQLGMSPDASLSPAVASAAEAFERWLADLTSDPDVGQDARMMVPVFYDLLRGKTKVWVFLGWSTRPVEVTFAKRPAAEILDAAGEQPPPGRVELRFQSSRHTLAYPVTAEVYVTRILDRDEFRRHCDTHQTRSAILRNLQ